MDTIRVIVADDHLIFREGLAATFAEVNDIQIVAEASDGKHLINLVTIHKPDVVLTDIRMPGMNGVEATLQIRKIFPLTAVIALSNYYDNFWVLDMLRAGAAGFLVKDVGRDVVIDAIRAAYRNEKYYCKTSGPIVTALIRSGRLTDNNKGLNGITEMEKVVLQLICRDMDQYQIADQLKVTLDAVKSYRRSLLAKTGANGTPGLVMFAIVNGIYQ